MPVTLLAAPQNSKCYLTSVNTIQTNVLTYRGNSVNPIQTKGADYARYTTGSPPRIQNAI